MAKVGRPRKPVLRPDMFGIPLRVNDFVLYTIPNDARTAISVGRIIGKNHCYLQILCLENNPSHYGMVHHKHGYQVYRLPPGIRQMLQDWDEDGNLVPDNFKENPEYADEGPTTVGNTRDDGGNLV